MSRREDKLREKLAAIEHERWSDWQRYMHSLCVRLPVTHDLVILGHHYGQWERQINTPYANLSAEEKASDMEQVDRYWPLIETYLNETYGEGYQDALQAVQRGLEKLR